MEWTVATKRKILLLRMIMGGEGLSCAGQLHGVHLHEPGEEKNLNIRQQEILDRCREGNETRSVWGHVFLLFKVLGSQPRSTLVAHVKSQIGRSLLIYLGYK